MAKNRGELRAEVVANHGGITGKDSVINTIMNLVVKDLAINHNWRDLQSLEAVPEYIGGPSVITGDNSDMDTVGNWQATVGEVHSIAGGSPGNCLRVRNNTGGAAQATTRLWIPILLLSGLTPGRTYRLSISIKNDGVMTEDVEVYFDSVAEEVVATLATTSEWLAHEIGFEAVNANKGIYIRAKNNIQDTEYFLVDTVILEPVSWDSSQQGSCHGCVLAAAAYRITVPTTIQKIEFVNLLDSDSNWREVVPLPLQDFRKLEDGSGTPVPDNVSQLPTHAHLLGNVLTFNRRADKAYNVHLDVFLWPTDMDDDADYPSITVADPIIITYATAWLYQHRKQTQTAQTWFGMADMFYKNITNEDHGVKFEFTRKQMGI